MKIDKKTLLIAFLALGWAHDLRVGLKFKKAYLTAKKQRDCFENIALLYGNVLIRNQIPMEPFEKIAIHEILSQQ